MSDAFKVGQTATLIVGVEGVVDSVTDDTVTIAGNTLPRSLGPGGAVRYLSMDWPNWDNDSESATDLDELRNHMDRENASWRNLIRADHDEHHEGVMQYCPHATCRAVTQ